MDEFREKEWYLWSCHAASGAYHMAVDDFLARQMGQLLDRPLLRFYTWQPYCVSLGYHQNISEINREKCRALGLDVVRRPTGGRAVLHAQELTYSVVYPFREVQIEDFYRLVHLPFVQALNKLGIPAAFQPAQADFRRVYQTDKAAVCFATSARYEVEIEGRKLIGSAQRVYEQAILQHGSLLLGDFHQKLVELLNLPEQKRQAMRTYIRQHAVEVWEYRGDVTAEALSRSITEEFARTFGIRFLPVEANPALLQAIEQIGTERFQMNGQRVEGKNERKSIP